MEELNETVDIPISNNEEQEIEDRRQPVWKSDKIDRLATALAKAQGDMKGAKASSINPFFKSNYADLNTVIESSIPYLSKQGLSVVQGHEKDDKGTFYVTTTLLHASGQWIRSKLQMPVGGKKDAQAVGATTTYARRFALSAMVGIAQKDDDGESVTNRK